MTSQGMYNKWKEAAHAEHCCFSALCKMKGEAPGYKELKVRWNELANKSIKLKNEYEQTNSRGMLGS